MWVIRNDITNHWLSNFNSESISLTSWADDARVASRFYSGELTQQSLKILRDWGFPVTAYKKMLW